VLLSEMTPSRQEVRVLAGQQKVGIAVVLQTCLWRRDTGTWCGCTASRSDIMLNGRKRRGEINYESNGGGHGAWRQNKSVVAPVVVGPEVP
jgi:hypothetical protein